MRLPSELNVMQLSPAKVERTFGLTPQVSLRDGFEARVGLASRKSPALDDDELLNAPPNGSAEQ